MEGCRQDTAWRPTVSAQYTDRTALEGPILLPLVNHNSNTAAAPPQFRIGALINRGMTALDKTRDVGTGWVTQCAVRSSY